MKKIETIFLDENIFEKYQYINDDSDLKKISMLAKINLFVGANNSGKSRFMRSLFSENNLHYHLDYIDLEAFNNFINELGEKIGRLIGNYNIVDYGNFLDKLEKVEQVPYLTEGKSSYAELKLLLETLKKINGQLPVKSTYGGVLSTNDYTAMNTELKRIGIEYEEMLDVLLREDTTKRFKKIYIPTLRGLRPLEEKENNDNKDKGGKRIDHYWNRTKVDYFDNLRIDEESDFKIFTGANMYEEVRDLLLGTLQERNQIVAYQKFLSENFFENQPVLLIPNKSSDVLYVKIGNERERPIHSLGDGIQSIIIMTFQVFYNKGHRCLFFIEEPEIYLHPGLQRKLIVALNSFEDCQFFLTTHSNHILDLTLDIEVNDLSIYKFIKVMDDNEHASEIEPSFELENVSNGDVSLLNVLGVKDSSVFLANCTIWVEGITDRFYLRHYLNLYMRDIEKHKKEEFVSLKEDLNYSFVEYAGNNITHWSFLDDEDDNTENDLFKTIKVDSICKRIFLVSDKDSELKEQRQEKLQENLGDTYYCLKVKEIENLVSVKTLKTVIKEYEKVSSVTELEFKSNFTDKGYANHYLGKFIENKLKSPSRRYAADSGTIKDKLTFCKKVIKHTNDINDLSDEARTLCAKLYNFILANNM